MSAAPGENDVGAVRSLLVGAGLRATRQRLLILGELRSLARPTSHYELVGRLGRRPLDPATVYRNLVTLARVGLAVRTQLGDGVWRYSSTAAGGSHLGHPHFVCTRCGAVTCVARRAVLYRGLDATGRVESVQLHGICLRCGGARR